METKINKEAKKEIILIFFSIFLIGLVSAVPPIPDHFIGDVLIDGQDAPVGTLISIYVDSSLESVYDVSEAGEYDLYVTTGIVNSTFKSKIEFKILDQLAGNYTRQGGEAIPLDLSVTTTPSKPPSPSSGGGSGGGGGGSGSGGGGFISPPPQVAETGGSSSVPEENTTETQETKEQEATNTVGMTGAVIGFLESGKGTAAIVIVIILVIGVILIKFGPQKWKKSSS